MLFTSSAFAVFLPAVFVIYWSLQNRPLRLQNLFILLASYVFYAFWDWRFLSLIIIGSAVDYFTALGMGGSRSHGRRKTLLTISLAVNLGLLGFFKYTGFFVQSFCDLLSVTGISCNTTSLSIILPVGISFYTFKKMSYSLDVYRERLEPERDAAAFFAFVAFFPQLMSGPIDRGTTLLRQFTEKRVFSDAVARDGLRQMLSGFMKKLIIADNLGPVVSEILGNYGETDGLTLITGMFFLAVQLYCDFSGYSDIAIGCGRLLGFNQMQNFAFPYFSRDIAEFWRRWHISLSTWLRDYLYVPLCGKRPSRRKKALNIVLTFTICGFWHDASWTYIAWGFIHGLYFLPMTLAKKHPRYIGTPAAGRILPSWKETGAILRTFMLTSIGWVLFWSGSFRQAFGILGRLFTHPLMDLDHLQYIGWFAAAIVLLIIEWFQREKKHFLQVENLHVFLRWSIYLVSGVLLLVFGEFNSSQFIYFQF